MLRQLGQLDKTRTIVGEMRKNNEGKNTGGEGDDEDWF